MAPLTAAPPERMRWYRSLRVQGAALAVVLVALPVLMFSVLAQADRERRVLVLNAVSETGGVVAAALAPVLRDLRPADTDVLDRSLAPFSAPDRSIRILFRPLGPAGGHGFFLLAAAPPIPPDQAEAERQLFLRLGIVAAGDQACTAQPTPPDTPAFLAGGAEVMTSVLPVAGSAGCWVIVIATGEQRILGAVRPVPYWSRPESRAALAIYAVMALLIAALFAGVGTALLRFRHLALSQAESAGFAGSTAVPELGALAAAFDDMVSRLRRSATMIRQAAEDNAHAFKGPIAVIRQALEPLRRRPPPDSEDAVAAIGTALARLDGLVLSARMLDSAAAELLDLEPARIDLSALVVTLAGSMAPAAAARAVRLAAEVAPGVSVLGQAEALESIVENLLDNAIGFSPPGGVVTVRLARRDGLVRLDVIDQGPGVAPERLPHLFERYYTHRPDAADGGAHFGIGLWIVRQNLLALGGTVTPEAETPHGLRMVVTLPPAAT
jgi:two-component system sensor histidine kinase ChvG